MRTPGRALAVAALGAAALASALAAPAVATAQIQAVPVLGVAPPGTNDFGCRPREDRPPIVLVHGTFLDMTTSWQALAPLLRRDGFCVFALDYGRRGTDPVDRSADELAAFTRRVLDATGAPKVSFVGHSQGGLLARWTVRSRGLLDRTEEIVGLAPSHHGTTQVLAGPLSRVGCLSCADQAVGSPFLARANAAPEAPAEIDHTVISTRNDVVVTPPSSQALDGPTATAVMLQDRCPGDLAEHVSILYDPVALGWVRHALLRDGPADPAAIVDCTGATPPRSPGVALPDASEDPAPSPAPEPRAVRLSVLSDVLRLSRASTVGLLVRCDGPEGARCVSLVRLRRGARALGTVRISVPVGGDRLVRLRVTKEGRALLRSADGAVRVTVRATTADGDPRVATHAATLQRS
ncbi:alpha/beta fold hydrolase [Conexibacter sp. W3-3-2]|uniref:esterase/lipase family protein n=1 Tax=Conexibacter sp. W3-3-2 TaxID=2675227 RepID=UPI0012B99088|nr:alpha/beta fold hydrolase [Conexibacter sp. W3-3-2]MTD46668.1 alpha/beta fold hydrolase [Conexibacter sp. W3-3-2]